MKNKTIKWVQIIGIILVLFGVGFQIYMLKVIGLYKIGENISLSLFSLGLFLTISFMIIEDIKTKR